MQCKTRNDFIHASARTQAHTFSKHFIMSIFLRPEESMFVNKVINTHHQTRRTSLFSRILTQK